MSPMKNPTNTLNRRRFLKRSTLFASFSILPSHFVFGQKSSDDQLPPSELVNLAAIGIGNQGRGDLSNLFASGHCNVVALCDVDLKGAHTQESQKNHSKARRFTDFRKMFDEMSDEKSAAERVWNGVHWRTPRKRRSAHLILHLWGSMLRLGVRAGAARTPPFEALFPLGRSALFMRAGSSREGFEGLFDVSRNDDGTLERDTSNAIRPPAATGATPRRRPV